MTAGRRLGVHTSIAGGLHLSLERAHALGCNTLQIFSHNPRGWAVKKISEEEASQFKSLREKFNISPVYIHTSYLINMASGDEALRRKSVELLAVEMERADSIGADYVILHAGSASGDERQTARQRMVEALNDLELIGRWDAGLLIENTSGKKGDISSAIAELSDIMNGAKGPLISGICFDTCHAFAAGYDIRRDDGIKRISDEIRRYIGDGKIKVCHLNDSKADRGSGVDRHEHLGLGKIGAEALSRFIQCRPFKDVPLILETPKKRESDDPMNLAKVRKMMRMKR